MKSRFTNLVAALTRMVWYPFLLVTYLLLNLIFTNLDQLSPSIALSPLIFLLLGSAITLGIFFIILKDWHYAGYLLFLILVFFFIFGHINRLITASLDEHRASVQLAILTAWFVLLILLATKNTWHIFGQGEKVTPLLNLIITLGIVSQLLSGAVTWIQTKLRRAEWMGSPLPWVQAETDIRLNCENHPDIYYIVVDGYGNQDVLQELYGLDNSHFLDHLRKDGFIVIENAHSNYTQTVYSLSSSLNMNYIGEMPSEISRQQYFYYSISNNRLIETLKQCSYQIVAFETGFHFTNQMRADIYLSKGPRLNEFVALLLVGSPIDVLAQQTLPQASDAIGINYNSHREWVLFQFQALSDVVQMDGPKFVFSHILAPHPPFVFDANGQPIDPQHEYEIMDGSAFAGDWEEYRTGYIAQVQFVNSMLEKTIEDILIQSVAPPIIILQGDHGPGSLLDWEDVDATCLWERTSILNAYYLPDSSKDLLYGDITPVNSFRFILAQYLAADLELLPDLTAYSSFVHKPPIVDVNERRDSRENCIPPQ